MNTVDKARDRLRWIVSYDRGMDYALNGRPAGAVLYVPGYMSAACAGFHHGEWDRRHGALAKPEAD